MATPSTRRSTAKRKLNQGLLDGDEIEEHRQQGNEEPNLEFTREVENALKICTFWLNLLIMSI